MEDQPPPPYAGLTPDCVLDALESVGLPCDGRLLALNSYENRVYQVYREDAPPLVAKFYRPGRWSDEAILEEHEFVAELAEREIPVVAAMHLGDGGTLHHFGGYRFAVYPRCSGRAPELEDPGILRRMGRFIARIHAVGSIKVFGARPLLDVASFGEEPRDYLQSNGLIPADLVEAYGAAIEMALIGARNAYQRAGDVGALRLHGDCHAGNVLWNEEGPHFVDFDDARMGPAVQDLWMLLAGDRTTMQRQLGDVLSGYVDFFDFNDRELHLLEALRTLRLIHYGWRGAGTTRLSRRRFPGLTRSGTGRIASWS
jgi:Ser/Thr protein kinase RdoA (MazF antagonist)